MKDQPGDGFSDFSVTGSNERMEFEVSGRRQRKKGRQEEQEEATADISVVEVEVEV